MIKPLHQHGKLIEDFILAYGSVPSFVVQALNNHRAKFGVQFLQQSWHLRRRTRLWVFRVRHSNLAKLSNRVDDLTGMS